MLGLLFWYFFSEGKKVTNFFWTRFQSWQKNMSIRYGRRTAMCLKATTTNNKTHTNKCACKSNLYLPLLQLNTKVCVHEYCIFYIILKNVWIYKEKYMNLQVEHYWDILHSIWYLNFILLCMTYLWSMKPNFFLLDLTHWKKHVSLLLLF